MAKSGIYGLALAPVGAVGGLIGCAVARIDAWQYRENTPDETERLRHARKVRGYAYFGVGLVITACLIAFWELS